MKKHLHMALPQICSNKYLSNDEKEKIYQNFKKRVQKKSSHNYVDRGDKPILLRLYFSGSLFDSITEFLVRYGSFEITKGSTEDTKENEIGFTAIIKTIVVDKPFKLTVLRKQFKAYLELMDWKSPHIQRIWGIVLK